MFVIFNAEQVRCVLFTAQDPQGPPSGQQMTMWLPAGTYQVKGIETIKVSDRGDVQECRAARLLKPSKDGMRDAVYYVSLNQIEETAGPAENRIWRTYLKTNAH